MISQRIMWRKNSYGIVTPLSRMKNNNSAFLSSRRENFLFKKIIFLKSEKKIKISEKIKIWFSNSLRFFGNFWDLLDFPLRFLYRRKGKSRKYHFSKKKIENFENQNFKIFQNIFLNYFPSSLERRDYCFSCGLAA